MNNNRTSEQCRVLGVSLSSRGFGYAVLEGKTRLIFYGKKKFDADKNTKSLAALKKLIVRCRPGVLALHDVNVKGTRRAPRIKILHGKVMTLSKKHKTDTVTISGVELRSTLLGDPKGNKHEMAEVLAKRFPEELASRLPPQRKFYDREDARMDTFDAVGLALTHFTSDLAENEQKCFEENGPKLHPNNSSDGPSLSDVRQSFLS